MKFAEFDPAREPDWRFKRAQELLNGRRSPNSMADDLYIAATVRFLRAWEAANDDRAQDALFGADPGLFYAHLIHTKPEGVDTRFAVEAYILAGQADSYIAKKISTIPEAIQWYERLFFNVRDRLGDRSYIVNLVRKQAKTADPSRHKPSVKLLGYDGGVAVLERLLYGFDLTAERPKNITEARAYLDRQFAQSVHCRAAIEVADMEINKYNATGLLEANLRRMDLDHKIPRDADPSNFASAVDDMLRSLGRTMGGRGRRRSRESDN